jgi:hypothetical protein
LFVKVMGGHIGFSVAFRNSASSTIRPSRTSASTAPYSAVAMSDPRRFHPKQRQTSNVSSSRLTRRASAMMCRTASFAFVGTVPSLVGANISALTCVLAAAACCAACHSTIRRYPLARWPWAERIGKKWHWAELSKLMTAQSQDHRHLHSRMGRPVAGARASSHRPGVHDRSYARGLPPGGLHPIGADHCPGAGPVEG